MVFSSKLSKIIFLWGGIGFILTNLVISEPLKSNSKYDFSDDYCQLEGVYYASKALDISKTAENYYRLGVALENRGGPTLPDAFICRNHKIQINNNHWMSPISAYKKAIEIDENFEDAYYAIGRIFISRNLSGIKSINEKGLIFLEKVIELNPNHLNANLLIAEIASSEYSRQPFKLVEIWSRIIKLDPNNGNAYFERGKAYKTLAEFYLSKDYQKKSCEDFKNASKYGIKNDECKYYEPGSIDEILRNY